MTEIFDAARKALQDLFRPQVLVMVAVPILCASLLWALIGWYFWGELTQWIDGIISATYSGSVVGQWVDSWARGLVRIFTILIALALLAPGVLITAMVITEFFTMPGLVNFVAQRYYPALAREHGGTAAGSIANSVTAIVIFALLWLVTLPLWFTGIGALIVPVVNSAYLNQRIFRHDAASDHASRSELKTMNSGNRRKLFLLGLLLAPLLYVPFANLLVPALTGLAFTHYQLDRLARLRLRTQLGLTV